VSLDAFMQDRQARVEAALADVLPAAETLPADLHQAMRYAALGGGKRIRPLLVYAAGQAVGADEALLDLPACSVELIHAYSLVHDDLPAMDDDDLRRGRPTTHKAFGEALAILAGDALQTLAFDILARRAAAALSADQRLDMVASLTLASGSRGMVGGQAIDMAATGQRLDLPALELMHIHKTGALIRASVRLGALCRADLPAATLDALDHYAKCIGLAFQIRDDILDVEADTATLGKTQGADLARDKPTYPALLGLDGAKQRAEELYREALDRLTGLGEAAENLRALAGLIVRRGH